MSIQESLDEMRRRSSRRMTDACYPAYDRFKEETARRYPHAEFATSTDGILSVDIVCRCAGRDGRASIDYFQELSLASSQAAYLDVLLAAAHRAWLDAVGRLPDRRFRFQRRNPKHLSGGTARVPGGDGA